MNYLRTQKFVLKLMVLSLIFVCFFCTPSVAEESSAGQSQELLEKEKDKPKKSTKDLELIDFANGLFQRNFHDMALGEYKKFITRFPESEYLDDAYFGIAESLFFLKSYKKAIGAYSSYKEFFPAGEKLLITHLRLGQSHFYVQDYGAALGMIDLVDPQKLDKDFVSTFHFYRGKILSSQNNAQEAYAELKKVIEISAKGEYTFLALVEMAELANRLEDYIKAIEFYQKASDFTKDEERKAIAQYKQGEIYLIIKRHKEAIKIFQEVLRKFPTAPIAFDAFSNLLIAQYNLEEYKEVLTEYEKRKKLFSGQSVSKVFKLYYILSTAEVQLGNYIGALTLLDDALALEGLETENVHKALIKKTEILVKIQKFDIAFSIMENQLSESSQEPDNLLFLKAETLYGLEKFDEAFDLYKLIGEKYPQSSLKDAALYSMAHAKNKSKDLREAANLFYGYFQNGNDQNKQEEALYNLILIQNDLKNLRQTIESAEIFVEKFQESPNAEKITFLLGTLYQKTKQYEKAIAINRKYIEQYPQSERMDEVFFLVAFNLQSLKKFEEALSFYQKLNVSDVSKHLRYPALKNAALIYISLEDKDSAAKAFDQIVSAFPENDLKLDTYIWVAEHHFSQEQFEDMLRIVNHATSKFSEDNQNKHSQVIFLKAQALRKSNQIPKAIKHYKSIIQDETDLLYKAASRIGLGLCYVKKKKYEEAKQEFETAILENTEDNTITMRARFEIANMYWELKKYEDAIKFYMFVSVLYDDEKYCSQSLYRAGQSFEALQKNHEAIKVYDELVIRYPQSLYYEKAQKRIKELDAI